MYCRLVTRGCGLTSEQLCDAEAASTNVFRPAKLIRPTNRIAMFRTLPTDRSIGDHRYMAPSAEATRSG